jgi:hypothetical protein
MRCSKERTYLWPQLLCDVPPRIDMSELSVDGIRHEEIVHMYFSF